MMISRDSHFHVRMISLSIIVIILVIQWCNGYYKQKVSVKIIKSNVIVKGNHHRDENRRMLYMLTDTSVISPVVDLMRSTNMNVVLELSIAPLLLLVSQIQINYEYYQKYHHPFLLLTKQ